MVMQILLLMTGKERFTVVFDCDWLTAKIGSYFVVMAAFLDVFMV